MAEAFVDSTIVVGLVFRHAGEQAACRSAMPAQTAPLCSRYVQFEVARGFLRSLIALHNYSFEFQSLADLHQAAYSGQQRFKPYRMHTWLAAFTDYFAALAAEDGDSSEALELDELRAKLRGWIRRGWRKMQQGFRPYNAIGCREDVPAPVARDDQFMDQALPDRQCGQPWACRLQAFIQSCEREVTAVVRGLSGLPRPDQDEETRNRIEALRHLLAVRPGGFFAGKQCHRSGDALICLEAPSEATIVTKNRKHFEPLTRILGKPLTIAQSARTTKEPGPFR